MTLAFVILSLLVSLVLHEYAHYRAMRADGIRIESAGLGFAFPPTLRIKARGIEWTLSPWLLGAYVTPSKADLKRTQDSLPYRRLAWHYGAGVTVNLAMGLAATAAGLAASRPAAAVILAALAVSCWVFRYAVAAYVQPALALPVVAFTFLAIGQAWARGESGFGLAGIQHIGPAHLTLPTALGTFGTISLALGLLNLLPWFPMDNGRTVDWLIRHWWGAKASSRFQAAGAVLVVASLVASVLSDGWALVTAVF